MSTVVVQQRARLFREGLAQLLTAEDDIDLAGSASSDEEVVALCRAQSPDLAIIEAGVSESGPIPLVVRLRRLLPKMLIIGLTSSNASTAEAAHARRCGMSALVSHRGGFNDLLAAIRTVRRNPRGSSVLASVSPMAALRPKAPTARELVVLKLVGAGLTSREISAQLMITHKTVEAHKQRVFAKFGVQNQAHAVSIAIRTGLMPAEPVLELALVH